MKLLVILNLILLASIFAKPAKQNENCTKVEDTDHKLCDCSTVEEHNFLHTADNNNSYLCIKQSSGNMCVCLNDTKEDDYIIK